MRLYEAIHVSDVVQCDLTKTLEHVNLHIGLVVWGSKMDTVHRLSYTCRHLWSDLCAIVFLDDAIYFD
jgi:hypothetical protein